MTDNVALVSPEVAVNRQTAQFALDERRLNEELDRFFAKYAELQERHREQRTRWRRDFKPMLAAAYDAYRKQADGTVDIPLMDIE